MKFLVAISAAALATAAFAAPPPADQAEVSEFACQLGGDCGDSTAPAAAAESSTPAATGGARNANVRGFTFKRTAPTTSPDVATAAPSPAMASASAGVAPKHVAPAAKGAANLRLDFASGSAELDTADRQRLGALANALSGPRLVNRRLRIEGHTDAKGSATKNLDLSRRRAQSVADYLVSTGVARGRLEVVGYGAAQPLPGHARTDGSNRRVMAVMLD